MSCLRVWGRVQDPSFHAPLPVFRNPPPRLRGHQQVVVAVQHRVAAISLMAPDFLSPPASTAKALLPLREGQQMETAKWHRAATISLPSPVLSYLFFRTVMAMPS